MIVRMARFALILLMLALAACGPRIQSIGLPVQAPALNDRAAVAPDGGQLPIETWAAAGRPRAVIVALHGFNDYRLAFKASGAWWAGRGITTYAYDQRGFGDTAHRGIWAGTDTMIRDLGTMVRLVRTRHPDVPLFLLGDSMGGAVVMAAMARDDAPTVDGIVLAAPAVWGGDSLNAFYRGTLWLAAHLLPANKATGRGLGRRPSDNIEMLRGLGRDPKVIKETRIDAVYGLVQLMDAAQAAAPSIDVPMLILYGARDELIPKRPVEKVVTSVTGPRRVAIYPNGWHMLLRDLQAEVVWRDVLSWIENPAAPLPSGNERTALPLFESN